VRQGCPANILSGDPVERERLLHREIGGVQAVDEDGPADDAAN